MVEIGTHSHLKRSGCVGHWAQFGREVNTFHNIRNRDLDLQYMHSSSEVRMRFKLLS